MKKISLILLFLFSFACAFGQPVVNRSNASVTVSDARFQSLYNNFLPRYLDTTAANVQKGIDSAGSIIYTYTGNKLWFRASSPKRWVTASTSSGSITSVSFLNVSGDSSNMVICFSDGSCDTIPITTNTAFATYNYVDSSVTNIVNGGCNSIVPNGNIVAWSGTGLKFYVTGGDFYIGCRKYTAVADSFTLSPADPTNPRFDVPYRDTLGNIGILEGDPASPPLIRQVNSSYQLALTAILVLAGATTPAEAAVCDSVYNENLQVAGGEWNSLATNISVNPNQSGVASSGVKSTYFNNIEAQGVAYYISEDIPVSTESLLTFKILFTTFGKQFSGVTPMITLGVVKNNFDIPYNPLVYNTSFSHGQNGFDSTNKTTWQPITVPISQFKLNSWGGSPDSIGSISISVLADTSGGAPGATFYIDEVYLQCGLNQGGVTPGNFLTDVFSTPGAGTDTLWKVRGADTSLVQITDRNCGIFSPGVVTWDSLLVFSVSPSVYRLCCDGVRRTSTQTQLTLDTADATFGRFDLIALDSNGVVVVQGDPSANPALPQPTECQLVLTYIFIPAGATEPGNGNNECGLPAKETIYDQTGGSEWTPTASIVTVNFSNTVNPYHLTIAADVGAFSTFGSAVTFTRGSTINLSQYSAIKFYIRLKSNFNNNTYIGARFLNSSTALGTTTAFIQNGQFNFQRTLTGAYQEITIPVSIFLAGASTTTVDRLTFFLFGSNSQGFYIDYIQLQEGICQPPTPTSGVTSFSAGNFSPLFTTIVTNSTTTPGLNFSAISQSPYVVYGRGSGSGIPSFNPLDTNYISGFSTYIRPLISLTTTGTSGAATYNNTTGVFNIPQYSSSQTLQQTFDTEVGGSVLTKIDTILGGAFGLKLTGTSATVSSLNIENNSIGAGSIVNISSTSTAAASNLQKGINVSLSGANATSSQTTYGAYISNSHSGTSNLNVGIYSTTSNEGSGSVAVWGNANSGSGVLGASNTLYGVSGTSNSNVGVLGTSGSLYGVSGSSTSSYGIYGQSTTGVAIGGQVQPTSTNTVIPTIELSRSVNGTAADGVGQSIDLINRTTVNGKVANRIISKWTTAADATRTSQFIITGVNSGTTGDKLTIDGLGWMKLNGITSTAASALTAADGMIVYVTDTDATFTSIGYWARENGVWVKW